MKKHQENNVEEEVSNDLKEFGVDSDAPDLFSSETEIQVQMNFYLLMKRKKMILRYQHS